MEDNEMEILDSIRDELQCSICLELYSDAISLPCGHNFCRSCISNHQSSAHGGERCPECRQPFHSHSITTDFRMNNIVGKIHERPADATQDAAVGEAKQLVTFTDDGTMLVNEDVLGSCFLRDDVKELPVCLISIIGEERKGKSFLLNYLLRRLSNPDCGDQEWMGGRDEKLCGFEWRHGSNATTIGVFIWSTPFLINTRQGQMAVFLVDTEGCDGVGKDKGISVQLSTLSMLLSSYLILNVSSKISQTDLDYLEIFVHIAQRVGEVLELHTIQQLDILVRDWFGSEMFGEQAGKKHLKEITEKIEKSEILKKAYPVYMESLLSKARCVLMPFPGLRIAMKSDGNWKGMEELFRKKLMDYLNCVLKTLPTTARKDTSEEPLNGFKLFTKMQLFAETIKKHSIKITTPLEMMNVLSNMKLVQDVLEKYQTFFNDQVNNSDGRLYITKTTPSSMRKILKKESDSLLAHRDFTEVVRNDLKYALRCKRNSFLETYNSNFMSGLIYRSTFGAAAAVGVGAAVVFASPVLIAGTWLGAALEGVGTVAAGSAGAVCGTVTGGLAGLGIGARTGASMKSYDSDEQDPQDSQKKEQ